MYVSRGERTGCTISGEINEDGVETLILMVFETSILAAGFVKPANTDALPRSGSSQRV